MYAVAVARHRSGPTGLAVLATGTAGEDQPPTGAGEDRAATPGNPGRGRYIRLESIAAAITGVKC